MSSSQGAAAQAVADAFDDKDQKFGWRSSDHKDNGLVKGSAKLPTVNREGKILNGYINGAGTSHEQI